MPRITPQSSRDWLHVALVATAAFAIFAGGTVGIANLAGETAPASPATVAARALVSVVIAFFLFVAERRRQHPSLEAAVTDALQVAVIVVLAGNLTGTSYSGTPLALRSALLLVGLPVLALLTHWLARRLGTSAP